ncbi:MAG: heme-binding beta-barrel domain-containing protein [Oligoflexia bacterium]|nr:heme-binding beta-barrel domain-containing protein [Oligoflexia bacterium]
MGNQIDDTAETAEAVTARDVRALGPLAALAGVWEGARGNDLAPSDDRGTEENHFRERITFAPMDPVQNHEQTLHGLRYSTTVWRLGEDKPFHEELGYWLWDPEARTVMRCFTVPRGVACLAGGVVAEGAKEFELVAEAGSPTFGVLSNPFLEREFKTVRYELKVTIHDSASFSYEEDTQLRMPGRAEVFHHRDRNTLKRVG